jgi:competence protein ComEC
MTGLIGFVAGVTACAWCASVPDWRLAALAGGACMLLARGGVAWGWCLLRFAAMVALGLAWSAWHSAGRLAQTLSPEQALQPVRLIAVLRDVPVPVRDGFRYLADVEQVETPGARVPSRIRLTVRQSGPWPAGSRWRLDVRLHERRGTANPSGFDAEQWLWGQGILASGSARSSSAKSLGEAGDVTAWIDRLRVGVVARVEQVLGHSPEAALIAALTVGYQQGLDRREWLVFARTGVTHLVSISGLHVSMIAVLAAGMARLVLSRFPPRRFPPRIGVMLAGLAAAAFYSLLAGWSVPTRRTLLMLAVAGSALMWRRTLSPFHIWWLALAAVVLCDPFAVYAPGLWLSFGLVAALMLVGSGRRRPPRGWRALRDSQWAAGVASVLPLAMFFSTLPLVSPLANLVAIPWISALVTPLALLAVVLPFDAPLQWAAWLCSGFFRLMRALADTPQWTVARLPWSLVAAGAAGSLWLLAPAGMPGRALGALLLAPALWYVPPRPAPGAFRASVFDVGQGQAVLVTTARHHVLYDTGAMAGEWVLLPQLAGHGVRRLDALVLSHNDSDHDGAARDVLQALPVGRLLAGQAGSEQRAGRAVELCRPGMRWRWDEVEFQVLAPLPGGAATGNNARSCVLRIAGRHGSLLLAGDIPAAEEVRLVKRYGQALASTVLVSPHHGSKTSSSSDFLRWVAPRRVVIACGYRNRYGHPHPSVLDRYRRFGLAVARTDQLGAIELELGPQQTLTAWRLASPRFWRPRPDASAAR